MPGMHRAAVSTRGAGYGRYVHTWVCSCGRQSGNYGNRSSAEKSARQHERNPR